jgi:hypothetical protein
MLEDGEPERRARVVAKEIRSNDRIERDHFSPLPARADLPPRAPSHYANSTPRFRRLEPARLGAAPTRAIR